MNKVTFVRQGPFLLIQFNTTCNDSIPVCDAMCCRMRPFFNIQLEPDEVTKYKSVALPDGTTGISYLPNGDCVYLDGQRCSVHADKPRKCREWHCSPYGNQEDLEIKDRANGWLCVAATNEVLQNLKKEP